MIVQYYYPQSLAPSRLDLYLASGWFRNAYMMYRAKLICLDDDLYSVINIRLNIANYTPPKSIRKIARKGDQRFTTIVRPYFIDAEKEALYQQHKKRFEGFIYSSLTLFFYGELGFNRIFNTYEVCVYDEGNLVAVSFFDVGAKSAASLLGLYNQDYTKHSLGTYTMIKEVEYAIAQDIDFYYPGYVLDKSPIFDYKLRLGEMQYYNWESKRWRKWQPRQQMSCSAEEVKVQIALMKTALLGKNITIKEYMYPLFSVGYLDRNYVRSPIFISCLEKNENEPAYIIEYWQENNYYALSTVQRVAFSNNAEMVEISPSFYSEYNFSDLLAYRNVIISSPNFEDILETLTDEDFRVSDYDDNSIFEL